MEKATERRLLGSNFSASHATRGAVECKDQSPLEISELKTLQPVGRMMYVLSVLWFEASSFAIRKSQEEAKRGGSA